MSKPATWYVNALKRTIATALPNRVRPDDTWAQHVLTGTEFQVYCTMPAAERLHGVLVAKCVAKRAPDAPRALIAAAILHDVGKKDAPNNWAFRVIAHLAPGEKQPYDKHATGLRAVRQALHHHAERGADLLAAAGVAHDVVTYVREHHEPPRSKAAALLRACDEEQ